MNYIDVCSGISAPTLAWKPLGWQALCYAEIEPAPRAVLAHHYPDVPRHGDFTQIKGDEHGAADLIVGGTPCQAFSLAGLRKGMDDDRGNLALEYIRLARRARTRWVVWENVPGVFTSSGGDDFRCLLAGLAGWNVPIPAGGWKNSGIIESAPVDGAYGLCWRVLDAQHLGVPQRRRRVFVVGYLGDWRRAAAVLLERHSMSGDPPPSRKAGQGVARSLTGSTGGASAKEQQYTFVRGGEPLNALNDGVAHTLRGEGFDASEAGTGRGTPLVLAHRMLAMGKYESDEVAGSLKARDFKDATDLITFSSKDYGGDASDVSPVLPTGGHAGSHANSGAPPAISNGESVRRLIPRECERLQGFPDDFTLVPWRNGMMPDGPRYKMLGNSMAVPVLAWIGRRIQAVEDICRVLERAA